MKDAELWVLHEIHLRSTSYLKVLMLAEGRACPFSGLQHGKAGLDPYLITGQILVEYRPPISRCKKDDVICPSTSLLLSTRPNKTQIFLNARQPPPTKQILTQ